MKIACRSVLILAGTLLTLVSFVSRTGADEGAISVYGSTTFSELIQVLGKEFTTERPDVQVKVLGRTSEFGFQALLNKEGDLVMAARKPNSVERRLAEQKRVQWTGVRVAWENVAVISHPGVSVRELTVDQLRQIYTGEYTNWRDLGGPDLPIRPHSMGYPQDDIALWFADNVLSKADFRPGIIWVNAPDFLIQHVSVHPGSVAYLGTLQLTGVLKRQSQSKVRVLGIRAKGESPAVSPSIEISKRGDYPLTLPLFLFWNADNPDKRIEQFARFCTERFQDAVGRTLK